LFPYNIELSISQTKYYISSFPCFFQELAFDPNKSMRNRIYIAYCVPHTCNRGDVSKHMEGILRDIPQKKITTSVGTVKCQTNTALPWTWGDYTFLYVMLLIKYYINNIIIILCFSFLFFFFKKKKKKNIYKNNIKKKKKKI